MVLSIVDVDTSATSQRKHYLSVRFTQCQLYGQYSGTSIVKRLQGKLNITLYTLNLLPRHFGDINLL